MRVDGVDNCHKYNYIKGQKLAELTVQGANVTDIADTLKVSRATVYTWRNKTEVKELITQYHKYLEDHGRDLLMMDVSVYVDSIKALAKQTVDKRTSLTANCYLLDRCLGRTTTKLDINTTNITYDPIDSDSIDKLIDDIVDVDSNEVDDDDDEQELLEQ
jgi:hypothetical protein